MNVKDFFINRITGNILAGLVLLLILVAGADFALDKITRHNREITVPDLTGMTCAEAEAVLRNAGMRSETVDSVYVRRMGKGLVYRQNPRAGSKVKEGRRVLLTINAVTAKKVSMPNLTGYSTRQAKAEILSKGLMLGKLIYVNDIATNNVLRQLCGNKEIKAGTMIESGSKIDLVVGLNPSDNTTYMPDVIGLKYMGAIEAIHDNSLNVDRLVFDRTVKNYADSINAVVYRQEPEVSENPLQMGAETTLYLTTDTRKVPVVQIESTNPENRK